MTELSNEEIRAELEGAIQDLTTNIPSTSGVPSFAYPSRDSDLRVRSIVAEYHQSARGGSGINGQTLPDAMMVAGKGYYAPVDQALVNLKADVDTVLAQGGWLVLYFHSIGDGPAALPATDYQAILEYVASKGSLLWVAPQAEVVGWIQNREPPQPTQRISLGGFKTRYRSPDQNP